jgi:hypothetical protein
VSTGLYIQGVIYINAEDLSEEEDRALSDVIRTPVCLTIPLHVHVNVPRLEWLYLGLGVNFNIPFFSIMDITVVRLIGDTAGGFFISLPIDIGLDFGGSRFAFKVTPHFFNKDTVPITFGHVFQKNMQIYHKS